MTHESQVQTRRSRSCRPARGRRAAPGRRQRRPDRLDEASRPQHHPPGRGGRGALGDDVRVRALDEARLRHARGRRQHDQGRQARDHPRRRPSTGPRTATGPVADYTMAQLKKLDAAHWFVPLRGHPRRAVPPDDYVFRGVRTGEKKPPPAYGPDDFRPLELEELMDRYPDVPINIEIKGGADEDDAAYLHVAEVLADFLNDSAARRGSSSSPSTTPRSPPSTSSRRRSTSRRRLPPSPATCSAACRCRPATRSSRCRPSSTGSPSSPRTSSTAPTTTATASTSGRSTTRRR